MASNVRVLCPFCKHIDHKGGFTASLSIDKKVGYCFYCHKTIVGESFANALRSRGDKVTQRDFVCNCSYDYKWVNLMEANSYILSKKALSYLYNRGCSNYIIDKYKFGLGLDVLTGRVVLPIYDIYDNLIYFQARSFLGREPKYFNPPASVYGVGKSEVIALSSNLNFRKVALCEGIFSAIAMTENYIPAIAVLGHTLSDTQLSQIVCSNVKEVVVSFDPGVEEDMWNTALKLNGYGINTRFIVCEGDATDVWDVFQLNKGRIKEVRFL